MKKKLVQAVLVLAVMALWGCTDWNPLFDGFGGIPIAHDGGVVKMDLSGPCMVGEARVCTDCNGQPQVQRCLGETWGDCPCPPDMRPSVDMASLPDLALSQDRQPAADLAPAPDLATECRPGEVQACVVCQAVGTKTCDVNGKFGACMPPKPVDCMIGDAKPCPDQSCAKDLISSCKADCTWGPCTLKTLRLGCGTCDPIIGSGCYTQNGCNLGKCTTMRGSGTSRCDWGVGGIGTDGSACGRGGQDDCALGFVCDDGSQICRKACDVLNPSCPQGRRCVSSKMMCFGLCLP